MPSAKPARDPRVAGLICPATRTPVALERVDVTARASGPGCRVVVHQHFRNTETVPLELVYVFPLDEGAAVCGFEAIVDGTRFAGQVKEREEAFADYDDAMAAGHGAYLLDEERADVFTASLGNVRPGAEVQLTITYVTLLAAEGGDLRFTLPTTVSPRYAPAEDRAGVGPTPAEVLNPPVADDVPYHLTFELGLEMPGPIRRVESPTHPVTVDLDGPCGTVRLTQRGTAMDRDLVVVIAADGLDTLHTRVEATPVGFAAMATLVPTFPAAATPADVVFLVDRSGSMAGTSIAEVRNALHLCLRALSAGCRFDIVGFGSTFASLFGASVPYDEDSLRRATEAVDALDADLGGTEILPALKSVLERSGVEGLPRQVVLLTDGEVTNTDEVIALARTHAAAVRIFTFGIGAGASAHLVRAVARATGGVAEFIAPGERIEAKVLRQFGRLFAPALSEVRVEWPAGVQGAPDPVPAVFSGEPLVVFGLSEHQPSGVVRLSGRAAGQPFVSEAAIASPAPAAGGTVGPLAARARIRDLEEQPAFLSSRGSRQRRPKANPAVGDIVRLAVAHQLVSRETSFVAIEERDTPVTERAELRRIPVALTSGWGDARRELGSAQRRLSSSSASMASPPSAAGLHFRMAGDFEMVESSGFTAEDMGSLDIAFMRAPAPRQEAWRRDLPHVRLVRLQRADGSWELDDRLMEAMGGRFLDWDGLLRQVDGPDDDERRRALATALAVAWLERHAPHYRDEWERASDKARQWLRGCGARIASGESLAEFAGRVWQ